MRPPGSLLPEVYSVRFHHWLVRLCAVALYVLFLCALFALLGDMTQTPPAAELPAPTQFPSARERALDAARTALRDKDAGPGTLTDRSILDDARELRGLLDPEGRAAIKKRAEEVAKQILDQDQVDTRQAP